MVINSYFYSSSCDSSLVNFCILLCVYLCCVLGYVEMVKKIEDKKIDWKYNLSEYWDALRNYKGLLGLLIFVVVLVELMQVVPKFLFKEIIDKGALFVDGSFGLEEFSFLLIVIAGLYILSNTIQVISIWFRSDTLARLEVRMITDLKMKYFKHILKLDHNFHSTNKTGSLISRINRGVASIERVTDAIVFNFAPMMLQLIIVSLSLAYFDVSSAVVILVIAVCFVGVSIWIQRKQAPFKIDANKSDDNEKASISDVFTNIDSVKYFGKENWIIGNFRKLAKRTEVASFKYWRYFSWMMAVQVSVFAIGTVALLVFPILKFLDGALSIGEIVFIYTIYGNLMGPMWQFVYGIQGFYRSMADFQDLFNYGKIESNIKDAEGAGKMNIEKGEIEFRDIDFGYNKRKIFKDFDLNIPAQSKVAFVGHSGCGKSTLVNLLYRFYDVDKGAVLIDGEDVRNFKQESLRGGMSVVPQECVLFDDSIWNNIKFSNPRANSDEIRKAIKFAQLDKIISEMPEKERTIVGERGVKLSGGEKQRVSIARAILADKKILVLDEATSALDSETEFEIQGALVKLMENRTSIIIAHRLSTIMHADKIVVMKRGNIVEMGTHGVLLRKKGEYARLWKLQKGGYIK